MNKDEKHWEKAEKLNGLLKEFFCTAEPLVDNEFGISAGKNGANIPNWVANLLISILENRLFLARIIAKQNTILDNINNELRKR